MGYIWRYLIARWLFGIIRDETRKLRGKGKKDED